MKILFASSEIYPYAKTGGLADVSSALPIALKKYSNISRVMPLYGCMNAKKFDFYDDFSVSLDGNTYSIQVFKDEKKGVCSYFIKAPFLSETKRLYGDDKGDYKNNALRFGIFCMAIIQLSLRLNITVIHLNDWHTALVALFVKDLELGLKTVFTIHNLAYQGLFDATVLELLGIPSKYFTMESLEFYEKVNFLKAGIAYSDIITTVSPTYAKEILTPEFGCGLDGFLRQHQHKLVGILNGIDTLSQYSDDNNFINIKAKYKEDTLPLFVMITRLVTQKGIDLLIDSLPLLMQENINLFILGDGDAHITQKLRELANKYENFYFFSGYNEKLSHQAYTAADFLLMPSTFEPCGLNQFIAMHYGTIPIVHSVGGLKDSVHENEIKCGRGIRYKNQTKQEFMSAIKRALALSEQERKEIIDFNMQCDFSFHKSALKYLKLYKSLV